MTGLISECYTTVGNDLLDSSYLILRFRSSFYDYECLDVGGKSGNVEEKERSIPKIKSENEEDKERSTPYVRRSVQTRKM